MAAKRKRTTKTTGTRKGRAKSADTGLVRTFLSGDDLAWSIAARGISSDVTPDSALTLPHYFACLRVISQTFAGLPQEVREQQDRGSRDVSDHRVKWLLDNPHPWMTAFSFRQLLIHWAVGWGLGMAHIVRDARGDPVRLDPMHPGDVSPFSESGNLWWRWRWRNEKGEYEDRYVPDVQCFRIYGLGGDGVTGYSLIRYAAGAIGQGLAHQDYGSSFFENGVWGSGVVEYPAALKPENRAMLQKSIDEKFSGPRKSFKPLLFEGGMKWNTLAIPNEDAQLIPFGNFNAYQVCRMAGVNPHKIGLLEGAKYKNIEEENVAWAQDGIMPWAQRWEQEGQRKLFVRPGRLYIHINMNALLRADYATRMEGYQKAVNSGWISPNQIRELEDMAPIPGPEGDAYYMQGANKTLADIFDPPEPPAPPPMPEPPGDEDVDEEAEEEPEPDEPEARIVAAEPPIVFHAWEAPPDLVETQRPAFDAAVRHLLRREANALVRVRAKHGDSAEAMRAWAEKWQLSERKNLEAAFRAPLACLRAVSEAAGLNLSCDLSGFFDRWAPAAIDRALVGEVPENEMAPVLADAAFMEATGR